MRRLPLLCIALLLFAGPVGAQGFQPAQPAQPATADAPDASAPALRGARPVRANETPPPAPAPPPVIAPPPALVPPPAPFAMTPLPGGESQMCRAGCARGYYFCLSAGDEQDDCGGRWGQCASACNRLPAV